MRPNVVAVLPAGVVVLVGGLLWAGLKVRVAVAGEVAGWLMVMLVVATVGGVWVGAAMHRAGMMIAYVAGASMAMAGFVAAICVGSASGVAVA